MKRASALVLFALTAVLPAVAAPPQAVRLRCEYRENPLGVDAPRPRLGWRIVSDRRGEVQTAYRVLVAASKEALAADRGDLWDSGKVDSGTSGLLPYGGKPLASGTDCYWKVKLWTKNPDGAEETPWSEPARFSIGLLHRSDWKGRWIEYAGKPPANDAGVRQWIWLNEGNPAKEAPAGSPCFRRVFQVKPAPGIASAEMRITADNAFELWVNGKRAGAGDNWQTVYRFNVESLLKSGDNLLAVKATNTAAGPAGMIGSLDIKYEDGQTLTVPTGEDWQAARTPERNWQTSTQAGSAWGKAKVLGPEDMSPWGKPSSGAATSAHVWYRKSFTLEASPARAFVYVASLGYHELYVNGEKADDRVLAPAGSRIDKRALYVTYDVTDKLRAGRNVLAVWHGDGWARFFKGFKAKPALLVQADIETERGQKHTLVSDETWTCHPSCSQSIGKCGHNGYGGELIDAGTLVENWNAADFDDTRWAHATATRRDVVLSAQMIEPDRVIETIKPVKMDPSGNGAFKVDMGRNFTGWLEIRNLHGSPGGKVAILVADDPKSRGEFRQESTYIFGEAPGTFRNRFNYACGRYVYIEGLGYRPKLADIVGYAVGTDFERTGYFECSDELLTRIYETDLWTFRANTLNGVTVDCPHRERLGYGEVSWATAWGCGLPNYRAGAFYTHMVRNWCDVQHEDGSIWFVAPHMRYTWGGPLWSSAPLTLSWEMYRHYGDGRILADAYPACKRLMEFFDSKVSDKSGGLLTPYMKHGGRFLGDWAAPRGRKEWGQTPEALLFNNCVYALDLKMMTDIAGALGREEEAARYAGRLSRLRENIHKRFFDAEHNVYLDARQVHLAFPLYVGVVPEDVRPAVIANLKKEITQTRPYLDMGSSGLPVLLHYLIEDAEWNDVLCRHLSNTTQPSYGFFLKMGETTWPEYWSSTCASKIHTCYTGVASCFIKGIGGIRNDPEQFGYKRFVIKPHVVGDLTFARTSLHSLYGRIVSNWTRKDGRVTLEVVIPPNSSATVYVPAGDAGTVTEGGRPAAQAEGVTFVRMENGAAVFTVGSGVYRFASTIPATR